MGKSFLFIQANLRRAKGQTAVEFVLVLLAACMMNLWLMLSMDYKQNFDRCHDRLHAEHVVFCAAGNDKEQKDYLSQILKQHEYVTEFSMDDALCVPGAIAYNGGETSTNLIILKEQDAFGRSIGQLEFLEEDKDTGGIYLPILYQTKDVKTGKYAQLTIGSQKMRYRVCGFFNSVMAGSHNCGMCEIVLTEDKYRELEISGDVSQATLVSVRILDKEKSEEFETMLGNAWSEKYPGVWAVSNSYAMVSRTRYISQMICSGVVSAMGFFVLLIVLVVVSSNITHYIRENMRNLGIWKAVGYKSSQLAGTLLLQFLGITCFATAIGVGLSYGLFPEVNDRMVAQTGIPYSIHFLPMPLFVTFAILCGAVGLSVCFSSRKMKKITPIDALRQGIPTHSFQRNHVPLEKTKLPLHVALSFKTALWEMKQNIMVCITMFVLSLVVVFSGLMLENMIWDRTPFCNLVLGEIADSCINITAKAEEEFLQNMQKDPRVEKIYLYTSQGVSHVGGTVLLATFCDDFSKVNNPGVILEGRFPEFDNEVAVGLKYARENEWDIGEEVRLLAEGKEAAYIISGFTQISNNLGKDCLLTRAGYEKMGHPDNFSYYLNLSEDVEIEDFHKEVNETFGGEVIKTVDISSAMNVTLDVYVSLMQMIVIVILCLSVIIIAFVLYLLVRAMMGSKKRDYGILKAVGFTTGQLMFQTALSFMPAVIVSTVVGLAGSCFAINPLVAVFLRGIGIIKCTFRIPAGFVAAAGIGLVLFAFTAVCLMSLRIRKMAETSYSAEK